MKMNWIKLWLDIVMAVLLFTLFSVSFAGLTFHEISGLVVFGLVIVHLILNWKWIWAFTKRLFSKGIPFKTRFGYSLNVLLLISFTMIIVTGIMISKVVLVGFLPRIDNVQGLHYFFSALTLVLLGIHTGLHWAFIKAMFSKVIKLPVKVSKVLGALALVSIMVFGGVSLVSSRFTQWLSGGVFGSALDGSEFEGKGQGRHQGSAPLLGDSGETLERPQGTEGLGDRGAREGGSLEGLIVVAELGSIMFLIAALTAGTETLLIKRKQKKAVVVE